jgi:4-hydroxythreonine-4-phosphate dehydrogenase
LADPDLMAARAHRIGLRVPIRDGALSDVAAAFDDALPVVPLSVPVADKVGVADPASADAVIASIDAAVEAVALGEARAVVTNPIQKSSLYAAGFHHPGHTEYLGELAGRLFGVTVQPVMMIAGPELRTVPITVHIPHHAVPAALTADLIARTVRTVASDLTRWLGLARPRLVVAGLNPHAGEDGSIGTEDRDVIAPVVAALQAEGIDVRGPLPADTLFHAKARALYDVALCPTHDQALIPAKTLAFDDGVNVTLGLPFVRTSPDHGTALGIAGRGVARPDSLIAALQLADTMSASFERARAVA